MRTSTFNYIKDILADYYKTDEYIKQREIELRHPYRDRDLNSDIKGNRASYNTADTMLITIEQDKRLAQLERNKRVISNLLDDADEDTKVIIEELYMRRWPKYTMQGLVDNGLIYCSRRKAFELQKKFFKQVAIELNLDI